MANYGKQEYWDERYQKDPEQFDWYQNYTGVSHIINEKVQQTARVLNIGCGNSSIFEMKRYLKISNE